MKKAIKIIFDILTWILLIFAFIVTALVISSDKNNGTASLFGYMPFTVESDSMKPTFSKNDLILDKKVDSISELKKGDVITFWTMSGSQRIRNTHRIVEVKNENGNYSFVTRGDNNPANDTTDVMAGDIIGKWNGTRLKGFGKAMNFLKTRKGFFICIIIPMGIFFIFELYKLIVTIIEMRRPEVLTESDEEEIKRRAIEEYLAEQKKNAAGNAPAEAAAKTESAAEQAVEKAEDTAKALEAAAEELKENTSENAPETAESAESESSTDTAENKS